MTANAGAAKLAAKPKPNAKKKPKSVLDLVVRRLYAAQEWLHRFEKQLGPHGDENAEPALEVAREKTGLAYQALVDLGHALPGLKSAGWRPASTTLAAGDLVQVKPKRIGRFLEGGAFTQLELARLTIASIHGHYAKVTMVDGTPLGLYPLSYFKPAPPALGK